MSEQDVVSSSLAPLDQRTVRAVLDGQAVGRPDRLALSDEDRTLSYAVLRHEVRCRAAGLWRLDPEPGRRIAVMLHNHVDMAVTCLAVSYAPLVQVPVNVAYRGEVLAHQLIDASVDTLIVEASFVDRLAAIAPTLRGTLRRVIVRGAPTQLDLPFETIGLDELDALGEGAALDIAPAAWDPMAVMYTSGTTGQAKGVVVTQAHAYTYGSPAILQCPVEDDVALVVLPLFHVGGQWAGLYNALIAGARAHIAGSFNGRTFFEDARRNGCTYTLLVGAMANFLLQQPPRDDDRDHHFRRMFIAPVPPGAEAFPTRFGVEVVTGYGSTEAGTVFVAGPGNARPKACGWPRPGVEVRVVDEHDLAVDDGRVGELVVRSLEPWTTMVEYLGRPDATSEAWRNGWYHTGDAMFVDDDGQYVFVDRLGDAIRRRGENIASVDVEQAVNSHPAILECAVVGVPTDVEHEVLAVCVLTPGESIDPSDLLTYLVDRLPYFMVPRFIRFVDELERTPSGKIRKRPLREHGIGPGTWDREAFGFHVGRGGLRRTEVDA